MATALIEGMLKRGLSPESIHVIDINEQVQGHWRSRGLSVGADVDQHLGQCGLWVLAVKPQQMAQVVARAKTVLQPGTVVVSIAAGISSQALSQWLGTESEPWPAVIRAMPNTPALVEKGMTGLLANAQVAPQQCEQVQELFAAVGEVTWVQSEEMIDAIIAVSGSGPAYVFRFIEAMVAGGEQLGMNAEQAKQLTLATIEGALTLARQSADPVSVLRERVTSKGGTTAAALDVLEHGQFLQLIGQAMKAAHDRAGALSREFGRPAD